MNNINIMMQITFDNPWLLLLMIPLIILAFIPYLKLKPKRRHTRNKVTSLILHCLIIVLACFVLSGIEGHSVKNVNSQIVLVTDYSESTQEVKGDMDSYITSFISDTRNRNSEIGVVYFGYGDCQYVDLAKPKDLNLNNKKGANIINQTGTDIENALSQAVSLFDNNESELVKRIILLTDTVDTDGSISSVTSTLNANDIKLDAIVFNPKDYNGTAEAQVDSLEIADGVVPFEPTEITVSFKSHSIVSVELTITDNGESIFEETSKTITLDGTSIKQDFTYEYTFQEAGVHELQASFKAVNNNDIVEDNNVYYSYVYLEKDNSILVIAPETDDTTQLVEAIQSYGYTPNVVTPINAPSLSALVEYREVILADVNIASLSAQFAKDLKTYVNNGGSLLTAGGDNTYANGSMKDSVYEDMLPITLTPTANNPRAIVLCLDYSNSMGMKKFDGTVVYSKSDSSLQTPQSDTRIHIAIKGIVESIKNSLNPYDYLSVITFGPIKTEKGINETQVIFNLTPATQKEDMIEKVEAIRKPSTEGGTDYDDALEYAESLLTSFEKKVNKKSVVLINDYDGGNDDAVRYMDTINRMEEKNIDFSVVVIGTQYSSNVSDNMIPVIGESNAYLTQTESQFATVIKELCRSIPTKTVNTLQAEDKFELESGASIGKGVNTDNLPNINTYNGGVATKDGAQTLAYYHNTETVTDPNDSSKTVELNNKDPIYAQWNYGKGKVGSLMIDLSAKYCPTLYTNTDSNLLLKNIIEGLAPKESIDILNVTVDGFLVDNSDGSITITNANYTRKLEVTYLTSDSDETEESTTSINLNVSIIKGLVGQSGSKEIDSFELKSDTGVKFEKDFHTEDPGLYSIVITGTIIEKDGNGTQINQIDVDKTSYTTFSYSDEYDTFYNLTEKINALGEVCNETYTENNGTQEKGTIQYYDSIGEEDSINNMITEINVVTNFQLPLMIIALILFVLDIAVRKFNFLWPHEIIAKMKHKKEE